GEQGVICDPLPIRRFKCCDCGRTFSWRPFFLVFLHRFTAAAYQQFLDTQASDGDWWQPGAGAIEAVRARLFRAARPLTERLERYLQRPPSGRCDVPYLLTLARDLAGQQPST